MKKTYDEIDLGEGFSLSMEANNFTVNETVIGFSWEKDEHGKYKTDKEGQRIQTTCEKKVPHFYGTLYNALQGFLRLSVAQEDSLSNMRKRAISVMGLLDEMEKEIKDRFRTEIQVYK